MSEPKITQSHSAFSMSCGVAVNIQARAENVWRLLTDAEGFPRWNSTVTRVDGEIREGQQLKLSVPNTKRTFTPKVSGVVTNQRMIWSDGFAPMFKGVRTFELTPRNDGSTDFSMQEQFSGLMLPLAKKAMPDFGPIFSRYASDLKKEAEGTENTAVRSAP